MTNYALRNWSLKTGASSLLLLLSLIVFKSAISLARPHTNIYISRNYKFAGGFCVAERCAVKERERERECRYRDLNWIVDEMATT